MCPVKILIRLRECAGWSKSSLGAYVWWWIFWRRGSFSFYGTSFLCTFDDQIYEWRISYDVILPIFVYLFVSTFFVTSTNVVHCINTSWIFCAAFKKSALSFKCVRCSQFPDIKTSFCFTRKPILYLYLKSFRVCKVDQGFQTTYSERILISLPQYKRYSSQSVFEPRHEKMPLGHMRTAKTQIILHTLSGPSLSAYRIIAYCRI